MRHLNPTRPLCVLCVLCVLCGETAAAADDFATRVMAYAPAPGQYVNNPQFNDPARALGAPIGGGPQNADNSKLVTLGGFGGSITLGFDGPVHDDPRNLLGLDLIVFGNAFYLQGDVQRRFAECGVLELSRDVNGNGLADDAWYVVPGSHLGTGDGGPIEPPFLLSGGPFTTWPLLLNPGGPNGEWEVEGVFGYADTSPVLTLGDTDADGEVDDAAMIAGAFYTVPDDPLLVGVSSGSGGGDAIDIAWAVDAATGAPAGLAQIDFVRITTGLDIEFGNFQEASVEVGGVARVRPVIRADFNQDGAVTSADITAFLVAWFAGLSGGGGDLAADFNNDTVITSADITAFLAAWFSDL
ncbi:MAG: hypothetical protein H7Y88_11190 [Phycisphaerales bacterium]|nr:hypothetical protein [Phycisphaerales bacterium]